MSDLDKIRELYVAQRVFPWKLFRDHLWRENLWNESKYDGMTFLLIWTPCVIFSSIIDSILIGFIWKNLDPLVCWIIGVFLGSLSSCAWGIVGEILSKKKPTFIPHVIKQVEELDEKDVDFYFERCKRFVIYDSGLDSGMHTEEVQFDPLGNEDYIFIRDGERILRIKALFQGSNLIAVREVIPIGVEQV